MIALRWLSFALILSFYTAVAQTAQPDCGDFIAVREGAQTFHQAIIELAKGYIDLESKKTGGLVQASTIKVIERELDKKFSELSSAIGEARFLAIFKDHLSRESQIFQESEAQRRQVRKAKRVSESADLGWIRYASIETEDMFTYAISPDRKFFAGISGRRLYLIDVFTGKEKVFEVLDDVQRLEFSPDGKMIALSSSKDSYGTSDPRGPGTQIISTENGAVLADLGSQGRFDVKNFSFSPDGRHFCLEKSDHVNMLSVNSNTISASYANKLRGKNPFSHDSRYAISVANNVLTVNNVKAQRVDFRKDFKKKNILSAEFFPEEHKILVTYKDLGINRLLGTSVYGIEVIDLDAQMNPSWGNWWRRNHPVAWKANDTAFVHSRVLSPDGRYLASFSFKTGAIKIFEINNPNPIDIIVPEENSRLSAIRFTTDSQSLLIFDRKEGILTRDFSAKKTVSVIDTHGANFAYFDDDMERMVTVSHGHITPYKKILSDEDEE